MENFGGIKNLKKYLKCEPILLDFSCFFQKIHIMNDIGFDSFLKNKSLTAYDSI